jgi:hypothetical protein
MEELFRFLEKKKYDSFASLKKVAEFTQAHKSSGGLYLILSK